jgi:hypothetical protein
MQAIMIRMASEEQIKANKENSLLSTGPKDTSGSRLNSLKHGLCAKKLVSKEEREELSEIYGELVEELSPNGMLEYQIVENMATAIWDKMRVYGKISQREKNSLIQNKISDLGPLSGITFGSIEDDQKIKELKKEIVVTTISDEILERYKSEAENRFYKALKALRELKIGFVSEN